MSLLLLRKFSLGLKNFLSLGLCGKQVEIRITSFGKRTLTLSLTDLHVLHNASSTLLQSAVTFSNSVNHFGDPVERRCEPGTDHVRFVRETHTHAQPLLPDDNVIEKYVLEQASFQAFQRYLPNLITIAEQIMTQDSTITLAYEVVRNQLKRLCDANGYEAGYEHFVMIMRLLLQYIPISFLVKDFLKNSTEEPSVNLYELFKVVIVQFDYIYVNLYSQLQ